MFQREYSSVEKTRAKGGGSGGKFVNMYKHTRNNQTNVVFI